MIKTIKNLELERERERERVIRARPMKFRSAEILSREIL